MKVLAFHSDKDLDRELATAFIEGVRVHGDDGQVFLEAKYPEVLRCDAVVIFGVKGRERFNAYRAAGINTIYLDKGYIRRGAPGAVKRTEYWRVAVNAHHPTGYISAMDRPGDRWNVFDLDIKPWRESGKHIVLAGSSGKFHRFHNMAEPTAYAKEQVAAIRKFSDRPIIYRPKPSWKEAVPISGASFSRWPQRIYDVLDNAHALVTNGSNSCFEAVLEGIPCVVLGDAVARPLSSTTIDEIESPRLATDDQRRQWFANLAYCQWTIPEYASGEAWPHVRARLT